MCCILFSVTMVVIESTSGPTRALIVEQAFLVHTVVCSYLRVVLSLDRIVVFPTQAHRHRPIVLLRFGTGYRVHPWLGVRSPVVGTTPDTRLVRPTRQWAWP
ncbi:hypothetical protein BDR06DRAFT_206618 [Suillus hirtellus]|nr:hypothetical protein BDR06DRAFT_206618 [Suillus hirtellus]